MSTARRPSNAMFLDELQVQRLRADGALTFTVLWWPSRPLPEADKVYWVSEPMVAEGHEHPVRGRFAADQTAPQGPDPGGCSELECRLHVKVLAVQNLGLAKGPRARKRTWIRLTVVPT